LVDKRITIIKDVITNPVKSFKEIDSRGSYYFGGAVVLLVVTGISAGFVSSVDLWASYISDETKKFDSLSLVGELVLNVFYNFFGVVLVYYIGKSLKGTGEFKKIFSTYQYSSIPALVGIIILLISVGSMPKVLSEGSLLDLLLNFISIIMIVFPLFVWSAVLSILAYKESHKFSGERSVATFILSAIVLGVISSLVDMLMNPQL